VPCLSVNIKNLIHYIFMISLIYFTIITGGIKDEQPQTATKSAKIIKNTTNVDQDEIEWDEYAAILRGQVVE